MICNVEKLNKKDGKFWEVDFQITNVFLVFVMCLGKKRRTSQVPLSLLLSQKWDHDMIFFIFIFFLFNLCKITTFARQYHYPKSNLRRSRPCSWGLIAEVLPSSYHYLLDVWTPLSNTGTGQFSSYISFFVYKQPLLIAGCVRLRWMYCCWGIRLRR